MTSEVFVDDRVIKRKSMSLFDCDTLGEFTLAPFLLCQTVLIGMIWPVSCATCGVLEIKFVMPDFCLSISKAYVK